MVAGWTGRDSAAIEHHIEELAALGVPRPSSVPLYYRMASLLIAVALWAPKGLAALSRRRAPLAKATP